jgi:DNA-binding transcriptional ArsR family regulator
MARPPRAGSGRDAGELPRRELTDPREMRALAHPVRLALLDALRREGPLTATRAAELLNDSPGNISWHLQTLAKYGFVEEAGGGRGRSRPWKVATGSLQVEAAGSPDDPERAAAEEALASAWLAQVEQRRREFWSTRQAFPEDWQKASFFTSSLTYLSVEEMKEVERAVEDLLKPYRGRARDKSARPKGSQPVQFLAYAHPLAR